MAQKDYVVLSFHESLLHKSDLDLLSGPYWLNDTIISFYFEYLEHVLFKDAKDLLFVPPQVTQCLKMVQASEIGVFLEPLDIASKRFIFLALNDNESPDRAGGTHWSLLVYSQPEKHFFHIDSLSSTNHQSAWMLATQIFQYLGNRDGKCDFTSVETLQQGNGYDCGVHLLCNVDLVVEHVLEEDRVRGCRPVQAQAVLAKRAEMLDLIQELANAA